MVNSYENQLKLSWSECERPNVYESTIFHGLNCHCCTRAKATEDRNDKADRFRAKKCCSRTFNGERKK